MKNFKWDSCAEFSVDEIYLENESSRVVRNVYKRKKHYDGFKSRNDLLEWWKKTLLSQNGCCAYCQTPIRFIEQCISQKLVMGRNTRGKGIRGPYLEIEKVDSNLSYRADNCVLICYYCNNDKSNVFNRDDYIQFHAPAKTAYFKFLYEKQKKLPQKLSRISSDELKDFVIQSLTRVKKEDNPLELDFVEERTLVGRIAYHLSKIFEEKNIDLSVDLEYTVGFDTNKKRLEGNSEFITLAKKLRRKVQEDNGVAQVSVIPDIVIHRRGVDGPNLAVVEVKIAANMNSDEAKYAIKKLELFQDDLFKYQCGVFVNLPRDWCRFDEATNVKLIL